MQYTCTFYETHERFVLYMQAKQYIGFQNPVV